MTRMHRSLTSPRLRLLSAFSIVGLAEACSSSSGSVPPLTLDGGRDGSGRDAALDAKKDGTALDAPVEGGVGSLAVLQHHGAGSRAGLYVDSAFTKAALPGLEALPGFAATISGAVFAQPLYLQGGVKGSDAVFVVTEANNVYALDANTGAQLWTVNVGTPEPRGELPTYQGQSCGSIAPLGITSTPIIDLASRSLLTCAMTMLNGQPDFQVISLSLDDGSKQWSVDLNSDVPDFVSRPQMQRGALAIQDGVLYVPFGGQAGACAPFHGWVVSVPLAAPHKAEGWHTGSFGAGIWGPSGAATDDTSVYVATASPDTYGISPVWTDNNIEAVLRITPGPVFSGMKTDYFVPTNWFDFGIGGSQLGAAGVVLFDQPASTPSKLAFAIGKTSDGYLMDRTNLGGIGEGVARLPSATADWVEGAMAAYSTSQSGYIALNAPGAQCALTTDLSTIKVVPGSPPTLKFGWCAVQGGAGAPIVTESSANTNAVVWGLGTNHNGITGGGTLRAFDGDTGALLAESPTKMTDLEHWISPIVVNGRIYVAGDTQVYAFDLGGTKHVPAAAPDASVGDAAPSQCLPTLSPDQYDPCVPFGLQCQADPEQQSELGTCVIPGQEYPCLPSVGCSAGLSCLLRDGYYACEPPCNTTNDCNSVFAACQSLADGGVVDAGRSCTGKPCEPTEAGAYYNPCEGGTCLPFFVGAGVPTGICMAGRPADAGFDAAATVQCSSTRVADGGVPLCPEGSFCFPGATADLCLSICDYVGSAFGDAGSHGCAANETCVSVSTSVGWGICAPNCGAAGTTCPGQTSCQLWNPITNQSACLP